VSITNTPAEPIIENNAASFSRGLEMTLNSKLQQSKRPVSAYQIPIKNKLQMKSNALDVENEIRETLSHAD
jgi:hypothetical protein